MNLLHDGSQRTLISFIHWFNSRRVLPFNIFGRLKLDNLCDSLDFFAALFYSHDANKDDQDSQKSTCSIYSNHHDVNAFRFLLLLYLIIFLGLRVRLGRFLDDLDSCFALQVFVTL